MTTISHDIQMSVDLHQGKNDILKKAMLFQITIKARGETTILVKPYKDFKILLYQLKKSYPQLNDLKLPYKGFFTVKSESEVIKERKDALVEFINRLLQLNSIAQNETFCLFFKLPGDQLSPENPDKSPINIFEEKDNEIDNLFSEMTVGYKASITDFDVLKTIGKGSFGRVYLVRFKEDQKYYALKVLEKSHIISRNETRHIMQERAVLLKSVKHPFLVGLHFSFQTAEKLYFILDYVNGGELFFHLQKEGTFSEARTKFYAAEIGDALGYLHSMNIIYRDLKPENLLLDSEGHIMMTDFGLAKDISLAEGKAKTFCGTPEYMAPEIILKQPYDKTVDWWSYGCVIYEMLNGLPPFFHSDTSEMYENIVKKELKFTVQCSLSSKGFIQALLKKKNTERLGYGPGNWNDIKQHPFLRGIQWEDLHNRKIKPPFVPNVSSELDLRNIDPEFSSQEITESIMCNKENPFADNQEKENPFVGFTYVQEKELD